MCAGAVGSRDAQLCFGAPALMRCVSLGSLFCWIKVRGGDRDIFLLPSKCRKSTCHSALFTQNLKAVIGSFYSQKRKPDCSRECFIPQRGL